MRSITTRLVITYLILIPILVYVIIDFRFDTILDPEILMIFGFFFGVPLLIAALIALFFGKKSFLKPSLAILNIVLFVLSSIYIVKGEISKSRKDPYAEWYLTSEGIDSFSYYTIQYFLDKAENKKEYQPVIFDRVEIKDSLSSIKAGTVINHLYYLGDKELENMYSASLFFDLEMNRHIISDIQVDEDSLLNMKFEKYVPVLKKIKQLGIQIEE